MKKLVIIFIIFIASILLAAAVEAVYIEKSLYNETSPKVVVLLKKDVSKKTYESKKTKETSIDELKAKK